mmetsp:Transcript_140113/g.435773  ORF Transcript_140113/g.435773 Transcript_140113/m.435773 type:complete len:251 (+) Transcript_140113:222-974(+)
MIPEGQLLVRPLDVLDGGRVREPQDLEVLGYPQAVLVGQPHLLQQPLDHGLALDGLGGAAAEGPGPPAGPGRLLLLPTAHLVEVLGRHAEVQALLPQLVHGHLLPDNGRAQSSGDHLLGRQGLLHGEVLLLADDGELLDGLGVELVELVEDAMGHRVAGHSPDRHAPGLPRGVGEHLQQVLALLVPGHWQLLLFGNLLQRLQPQALPEQGLAKADREVGLLGAWRCGHASLLDLVLELRHAHALEAVQQI